MKVIYKIKKVNRAGTPLGLSSALLRYRAPAIAGLRCYRSSWAPSEVTEHLFDLIAFVLMRFAANS
jgi:hypothetical protein